MKAPKMAVPFMMILLRKVLVEMPRWMMATCVIKMVMVAVVALLEVMAMRVHINPVRSRMQVPWIDRHTVTSHDCKWTDMQ